MTTRKKLAKILSAHFDIEVKSEWLKPNYADFRSGKNYGFAFSWSCEPDTYPHILYGLGSHFTMTEFVKQIRAGKQVALIGDELGPI